MLGKLVLAGFAIREYQHRKNQKSQQITMADLEAENLRLRNLHQANQYAEAEREFYNESVNEKALPHFQPEKVPQRMHVRNEAGGG